MGLEKWRDWVREREIAFQQEKKKKKKKSKNSINHHHHQQRRKKKIKDAKDCKVLALSRSE